jgi:hypothetical protein
MEHSQAVWLEKIVPFLLHNLTGVIILLMGVYVWYKERKKKRGAP